VLTRGLSRSTWIIMPSCAPSAGRPIRKGWRSTVSGIYGASQPLFSAAAEEQVLALLEAEQRDRVEGGAVLVLGEDDRVVRLQFAEFGREGEGGHDRVAIGRAARGDDAQLLVFDVVQECVIGHGVSFYMRVQMRGRPCLRIWSSSSRFEGRAGSMRAVRRAASRKASSARSGGRRRARREPGLNREAHPVQDVLPAGGREHFLDARKIAARGRARAPQLQQFLQALRNRRGLAVLDPVGVSLRLLST
jgi:hypothetical protein